LKLAAVLLVSIGTVGVLVTFVLMRRKLEQLRHFNEDEE